MSPVAYVTSAIEKDASCITRPIFRLAWKGVLGLVAMGDVCVLCSAHLVHFLEDRSESRCKGITLLGKQVVPRLSTLETKLHVR
jgi:hypothetical protein